MNPLAFRTPAYSPKAWQNTHQFLVQCQNWLDTKPPYSLLIHSPYGGKEARLGSWRAVVEAQKAGKARSIGVSNYGVHHLNELEEYIKSGIGGKIDVGQYELHPWLPRRDIVEWLQNRGAVVEAYSPLVRGTRMDDPTLLSLAKKHGKTPAQILLRWSLQKVWFLQTYTSSFGK